MRTKHPNMPKPERHWVKGPSLSAPREELRAWLAANPRRTRVAIVMKRGDVGFSMRGAMIGALEVWITDAALGIGIAMRARTHAGDTCPFIVEGRWHADEHYEIYEAGRAPATPDELAAQTHLEVERD